MDTPKTPPPPPPQRHAKGLSLDRAIATAAVAKSQGETSSKPLLNPMGEFPSIKDEDMKAHLLELQADIINREEHLNKQEKRMAWRERELTEKEALMEARRKVIDSQVDRLGGEDATAVSKEEREALEALRSELEVQEQKLIETRKMLRERELFIEKCENELVEKSMLLTEREARLDQREEDFETMTRDPFAKDRKLTTTAETNHD